MPVPHLTNFFPQAGSQLRCMYDDHDVYFNTNNQQFCFHLLLWNDHMLIPWHEKMYKCTLNWWIEIEFVLMNTGHQEISAHHEIGEVVSVFYHPARRSVQNSNRRFSQRSRGSDVESSFAYLVSTGESNEVGALYR